MNGLRAQSDYPPDLFGSEYLFPENKRKQNTSSMFQSAVNGSLLRRRQAEMNC
jgi:hypothetical protein